VIQTHDNSLSSRSVGSGSLSSSKKQGPSGQLASPFWKDLCRTVLPLHRAIAGLHYHGSDSRLLNSLETLAACGANMNACDDTGNNAIHKAIHVCTSNSVVAVVEQLLVKGCSATIKNRELDTPLHVECKRYIIVL
jgi:ankyrin repeat protein